MSVNFLYAEKEKNISCLCFKTTQMVKKCYFLNDFKREGRMALSCSQKTIGIIKKNNASW